MAEAELTHLERRPLDLDLAERQHEDYAALLRSLAAEVTTAPALPEFPDSCFVEDVALAFPECIVLTRPGAQSRLSEPETLAPHLPGDRPIVRLTAPARLDGGDVLVVGKSVFVGLSTRTNAKAAAQLDIFLRPHGYSIASVRVQGALHLKTAVTALSDGRLLINPAWIDPGSFEPRATLLIAPEEPFAANTLSIGGAILVQSGAPRTAGRLQELGLDVRPVDISQFAAVEAGLTCLSLIIPDPA